MNTKIYSLLFAALLSAPFAEAQIQVIVKQPKQQKATAPAVVTAPAPKPSAETFAKTITADDLSKYLHVLASDEYEGRETGQKGQKMAAEYISTFFRNNNLIGPTKGQNPYYQTFELEQSNWKSASMRVDKQEYNFLRDFYLFGDAPEEASQQLDLIFAGYGIQDKYYTDFPEGDMKGKTVVMFAGEPSDAKGNFLVSGTKEPSAWADHRSKVRLAVSKGAKNVIIISKSSDEAFQKQIKGLKHYLETPVLTFPSTERKSPTIFVSETLGAVLLNTTPKKIKAYEEQVKKTGKPANTKFKTAQNVSFIAEKTRVPLSTENVLGFIEGTDKKDEVLVITAHYDHIGKDPTKTGDQIFNGADDDGSGTSAVMELAQAFSEAKKAGAGPRRSILFMTVTGEEKGLLGSEYYTTHPVFPLANTIADLNIDMIGRLDKTHINDKNYIYLIGSDKLSSELHQISETANQQHTNLKLDYTYNDENEPNRFYYRSDHYNFARFNIPVIFYFNGVHEDYHKETDEVGKILFDKMENITRLVFYTAWELANRDERIKVDSNKK